MYKVDARTFATSLCQATICAASLLVLSFASPRLLAQPAAQENRGRAQIDSLVSHAMGANLQLKAAASKVEAATHRISPAGAWPDPMLALGVQNFPASAPGFSDFMTMKMVSVGQSIPHPGKLPLRTRTAEYELQAAHAELESAQLSVTMEVKRRYYTLAYLDSALQITKRNQRLILNVIQVSEALYESGGGSQSDILGARIAAAELAEQLVGIVEQRAAELSRLNALLDRPSDAAVLSPRIPDYIVLAAVGDSTSEVLFLSAVAGARTANSPLPPLAVLQEMAVAQNAELRVYTAAVGAQTTRAELARKDHLPDYNISLSYGQRSGFTDMITAVVSVPIALQAGRKQSEFAAASQADLGAREAERAERSNQLRSDVAQLHAEIEGLRSQLALYSRAVLPQGLAAMASATASYELGGGTLRPVLDAQAALFQYHTTFIRYLSDFATKLAELDNVVGSEVVR